MIPYGKQDINQQDIDRVVSVLKSDFITQGKMIDTFEEEICKKVDSNYAIAVNSATSALHLACRALGVGKGDLVWTSPISFVASANCALYCQADIDFIDIDRKTINISITCLKKKLEYHRLNNLNLPKVIIVVHMAGHSADMLSIKALADEYGFYVIEDASHAIGSQYMGEPVGCCQYSDIAVFSFHPVKIVTTGEGGVLTTNRRDINQKLRLLRSHGITRDIQGTKEAWYYEQIELGYNYRLTDIQAALGYSQLSRLNEFVLERRKKARYYTESLSSLDLTLPNNEQLEYASWHLYIIQLESNDRSTVFNSLREKGIGVNVHYIPIYNQPYYQKLGFSEGYCPEAERYYERAISLPLFPSLSLSDQDYIVSAIKELVS